MLIVGLNFSIWVFMSDFDSIVDDLSAQVVQDKLSAQVFDKSLQNAFDDLKLQPSYQLTKEFTDDEYYSVNAYSSTLMRLYIKNPDLYNQNNGKMPKYEIKQTASKKLGSIIHRIVLEGHKIEAYKPLLTEKELEVLPEILSKLVGNEYVMNILKNVEAFEKPIYWSHIINDKNLKCKAKIDLVTKSDCLFELKTCNNLSEDEIRKQIDNFRYDFQLSFYANGWENYKKTKLKAVGIIAIETEPPFGSHVYNLSPAYLERGSSGGHNRYKQPVPGWKNVIEEMHFNPTARFNNYYTILDI